MFIFVCPNTSQMMGPQKSQRAQRLIPEAHWLVSQSKQWEEGVWGWRDLRLPVASLPEEVIRWLVPFFFGNSFMVQRRSVFYRDAVSEIQSTSAPLCFSSFANKSSNILKVCWEVDDICRPGTWELVELCFRNLDRLLELFRLAIFHLLDKDF